MSSRFSADASDTRSMASDATDTSAASRKPRRPPCFAAVRAIRSACFQSTASACCGTRSSSAPARRSPRSARVVSGPTGLAAPFSLARHPTAATVKLASDKDLPSTHRRAR